MPLPFPGQDAVPFTTLTAQFYDETIANIESLADGSGFDAGAVGVADRSGGFFIGQIAGATLSTTGNKAITGVGFTPKAVLFSIGYSSSTSVSMSGSGSMTAAGQFYNASASDTAGTTVFSRTSSTAACFGWISAGSSTPLLLASYVSMDADGFTVNVSTGSASFPVNYIALG
jgi:hypothetical protein